MKRHVSILTCGRFTRRHPKRGVTLLEILVSVGVMVAILGIGYGMVIESERSSQKIDQRETAMVYCQRVIERVSATLRAAVPPSALADSVAGVEPLFESNRLAVMVLDRESTGGLALVSIALDPDGRDGAGAILYRVAPVGSAPESVREDDFYLTLPPKSQVSLEFGYAGPQEPDALASYQPTFPADGWPSLVRIQVRVSAGDESGDVVALETAVIPSMISLPVQAVATPEPVPEVTPAPMAGTNPTTETIILDALTTAGQEVTQ